MKPFLIIARDIGGYPCYFCPKAELASVLKLDDIDIIYADEEYDPRIKMVRRHFGDEIPTPILFYKGMFIIGAVSVYQYLGFLKALEK